MLCASLASVAVCFHGVEMPVCRIHDAKYARWGTDAEAQALQQWAWTPPEAHHDPLVSAAHLMPTRV